MSMNQYLLAFITGLTSGGISCLAVQGGLLASAIDEKSDKYKGTLYFLISKIVAYSLLGAIFGAIGNVFSFSITTQGILQILIGFFMLATAGRLVNLHPIFRYTVIQPPTFLLRKIKGLSNEKNILTPILLGAMTVLIPCGITQAMLILAMGTGNALSGGAIMLFFTIGTSPVFFALGMTIQSIFKNAILSKVAAFTIIIIGLSSINNGQVLRNSPHTFQNYLRIMFNNNDTADGIKIVDGKQEVVITATNSGYKTSTKIIKKGIPVKLIVNSKNVQSCARSFVIPSLKISRVLPINGSEIIDFTPNDLGILNFSCGMGMYTGSFEIIN